MVSEPAHIEGADIDSIQGWNRPLPGGMDRHLCDMSGVLQVVRADLCPAALELSMVSVRRTQLLSVVQRQDRVGNGQLWPVPGDRSGVCQWRLVSGEEL